MFRQSSILEISVLSLGVDAVVLDKLQVWEVQVEMIINRTATRLLLVDERKHFKIIIFE
jgi:hypothetical protein